jgi:D-3-phosphoglycerate dehydrogenase
VRQVRASAQGDYSEHIEVLLRAGAAERRVAGALLGEGHPRVVRVDDFRIDVVPRGTLVLCWNHDVPGVIGRVGTLLGAAGVNIGEYHQARLAAGGEALAAISVDGRLSAALLAALRALPEVHDVREVELGV